MSSADSSTPTKRSAADAAHTISPYASKLPKLASPSKDTLSEGDTDSDLFFMLQQMFAGCESDPTHIKALYGVYLKQVQTKAEHSNNAMLQQMLAGCESDPTHIKALYGVYLEQVQTKAGSELKTVNLEGFRADVTGLRKRLADVEFDTDEDRHRALRRCRRRVSDSRSDSRSPSDSRTSSWSRTLAMGPNTEQLAQGSCTQWAQRHASACEGCDPNKILTLATVVDQMNAGEIEVALDMVSQQKQSIQAAKAKGGPWGEAQRTCQRKVGVM